MFFIFSCETGLKKESQRTYFLSLVIFFLFLCSRASCVDHQINSATESALNQAITDANTAGSPPVSVSFTIYSVLKSKMVN